jgi:hypothetical protein
LTLELLKRFPKVMGALLGAGVLIGFVIGMQPTNYGHVGTHPFIFVILPFVSSLSPILALLTGAGFAAGDLLFKGTEPNLTIPVEAFVFLHIGVLLYALLPGILSRVAMGLASNYLASRRSTLFDGGRTIGLTRDTMMRMVASIVGALVGTVVGMMAVIPAIEHFGFITFPPLVGRPPDNPCYALSLREYTSINPANNPLLVVATMGGGAVTGSSLTLPMEQMAGILGGLILKQHVGPKTTSRGMTTILKTSAKPGPIEPGTEETQIVEGVNALNLLRIWNLVTRIQKPDGTYAWQLKPNALSHSRLRGIAHLPSGEIDPNASEQQIAITITNLIPPGHLTPWTAANIITEKWGNQIDPTRWTTISPTSRVTYLNSRDFFNAFLLNRGIVNIVKKVSGFVDLPDPSTGERGPTHAYINAGPEGTIAGAGSGPHELLHLYSNFTGFRMHMFTSNDPLYTPAGNRAIAVGTEANEAAKAKAAAEATRARFAVNMCEGITEYFAQQVTAQAKVPHNPSYHGQVQVIQEISKVLGGDAAISKAYFGSGTDNTDALMNNLRTKVGTAKYQQFIQAMSTNQFTQAVLALK